MSTIKIYEDNHDKYFTQYLSADTSELISKLSSFFEGIPSLNEFGSGSGRDAFALSQKGFTVTGFDGSLKMINSSKNKFPGITFIKYDITSISNDNHIPMSDGSFSVATLMHLNKKELFIALSKIFTSLYEKGKFYLSVSLERTDVDGFGYDSAGRYFLTKKEDYWINILTSIGFSVDNTEITADVLGRESVSWGNFYCTKN